MVTASGEALIWGEAGGALNRFADAMECYRQMLGPGNKKYKYGFGGYGEKQYKEFTETGKGMVHKWIACINPSESTFLEAFRTFFDSIYKLPAQKLGYPNWGLKEVQADVEVALFFRTIFINAKFIFLVRNPVDCLTSIKKRRWMDSPDMANPVSFFANHWLKLAKEFRKADFGYKLKYEELINSPGVLTELSNYLEIDTIPRDFIRKSNADWKAAHDNKLSFIEKRRLIKIVKSEMEAYAYNE
jgi:hypothetical protein